VSAPEAELAAFVRATTLSAMPAPALDAGRRLLLDALASAFAGRQTEERPSIERLVRQAFGTGDAAVIGGEPLAPAGAALLNGFEVTAATICDVHRPTLTHVSPEVVPALLAAAADAEMTGAELLAALIVGAEVCVRVAEALDGDTYRERAWHNPGIVGPIGAAAAVARLRGLDERGIRSAMAHGASQAAGTFVALGTDGVKLHQARGAFSGLLAGQLAAAGLDAAEDALSAPRGGLLAAYAGGGAPERLTADLGTDYRMMAISLRRWPAASSLQGVVAATLGALAAAHSTAHGGIRSARVALPPRGYRLNGTAGWDDQLSAMQSARWIVAVIIEDGELWIEQTLPARLRDPEVGRFAAEWVQVSSDVQLPANGARVTLVDTFGTEHTVSLEVPPGDPAAPLSDEELRDKLRRSAAGNGLADRAEAIIAAVTSLTEAPSVRPLLDLLPAGSAEQPPRHAREAT
jgi:2-methylcitrate dehydratase PrpD